MKKKKSKREILEGIIITCIGLAIAGVGVEMIFPKKRYATGVMSFIGISPVNDAKEAE